MGLTTNEARKVKITETELRSEIEAVLVESMVEFMPDESQQSSDHSLAVVLATRLLKNLTRDGNLRDSSYRFLVGIFKTLGGTQASDALESSVDRYEQEARERGPGAQGWLKK